MQFAPVLPAQVPPVQLYEDATGVQLATKVEAPPVDNEVGVAVKVQVGGRAEKVAVTLCAEFIVTVQLAEPVHAPLHPVKVEPPVDVAVRVTLLPLTNEALHSVPQLMLFGVLVTTPVPPPEGTLTVRV